MTYTLPFPAVVVEVKVVALVLLYGYGGKAVIGLTTTTVELLAEMVVTGDADGEEAAELAAKLAVELAAVELAAVELATVRLASALSRPPMSVGAAAALLELGRLTGSGVGTVGVAVEP